MADDQALNEKSKKAPKRVTGLGRGLNSLFGEIQREEPITTAEAGDGDGGSPTTVIDGLRSIAISDIRPNPDQPRQHFDSDALDELADSMRQRGVIQPIVVRPHGKNFQIVAGERRWRAAQRARLHQIPAVVRKLSDEETLEIAIVENVQRKDLNVIEEAEAYARLSQDFGHSQSRLAEVVGKSRSHIANLMRLLELPASVKALVVDDKLTMGHARALINAPNAEELAPQIVKQGLSVRDVERLVRKSLSGQKPASAKKLAAMSEADADIQALQTHLGDLLGLKVKIQSTGQGGTMAIEYANLDQLDLICQRLTGEHI
ncbi:MAG: ParB/RepB/Spo0J family partition protein [Sphingomonadales bacterium]|nr:ParB/RepB/Spo0J family partition protein [Sphingomonadales bacterium]PIX66375.1 MAG: chromosome partitioning protein ParB [Sphingomonadales bacterium CG_4_10_14_3_um_filter_58_15]NCO48172.1 ParB/RepB/Spo0J family partition protein [Sphingomonadales bacterium]NCO99799.1 ParB/RepB/Spo0J family partition protein [Sphingomonadales bacterium]NCP28149.1 ParB/RepB/Spo0J family partition protein [Sphingomonadales bacterium]